MSIVETRTYVDGPVNLMATIHDDGMVEFAVTGLTSERETASVSADVLRQLADLADAAKAREGRLSMSSIDENTQCLNALPDGLPCMLSGGHARHGTPLHTAFRRSDLKRVYWNDAGELQPNPPGVADEWAGK